MEDTTLRSISLDSLIAIAERLDGISVTLLAQTCPKLHTALFRDGQLRTFQVCARRFDNRFRIPSFVGLLPYLTNLSISLGEFTSIGTLSTYISNPLPRTLQILRLEFLEAEVLFSMSPLETALIMLMRHPPKDGEESVSDLKTAFPNLHTLELTGTPSIRPVHIPSLPPTLTRLSFSGYEMDNDTLGLLPRGLISLTMRDATVQALGLLLLPPTLEELVLPRSYAGVEEYQSLPPSITRFKNPQKCLVRLPSDVALPTKPKSTRKGPEPRFNTAKPTAAPWYPVNELEQLDVTFLPRTLTNLQISFRKCQNDDEKLAVLLRLPPNLKELRMEDFSANASSIQKLPRTLKNLVMLSDEQLLVVPASSWPPKLEKLAIFERHATSTAFQLELPDTLTSLRLGEQVMSGSYLKILPKTLKKLCLANTQHLTFEDYENIPRNLMKLELLNLGKKFNSGVLGALPQTLKSLFLHGNASFDDNFLSGLPKTLTELVIEAKNTKWLHSESFTLLPPRLKTLGINCQFSSMPLASLTEAVLPDLTTLGSSDFFGRAHSENFVHLASPRIASHFFISDASQCTLKGPVITQKPLDFDPPMIRILDPSSKRIGARKPPNSLKRQNPFEVYL